MRTAHNTLTILLILGTTACSRQPTNAPDKTRQRQLISQTSIQASYKIRGPRAPSGEGHQEEIKRRPMRVKDPLLQRWLDQMNAPKAGDFMVAVPYERELARQIEESRGTTSWFLKEAYDPHRGVTAARRTVYAAGAGEADLIHSQFQKQDLTFTLRETANTLTIEVSSNSHKLTAKLIDSWLTEVFWTKDQNRDWSFDIPDNVDLSKGSHHFTNKGAPSVARISTRDDRADIIVSNGRFSLTVYKKIAQRFGFQAQDRWFPNSTRRKIQAGL